MTLIINIPDDEYKTLKSTGAWNSGLIECIKNGTLLPKGHGKIIDYGYVVDAIDDWLNAGEYRYSNATYYLRKRVANIPTIIEADKESKGE